MKATRIANLIPKVPHVLDMLLFPSTKAIEDYLNRHPRTMLPFFGKYKVNNLVARSLGDRGCSESKLEEKIKTILKKLECPDLSTVPEFVEQRNMTLILSLVPVLIDCAKGKEINPEHYKDLISFLYSPDSLTYTPKEIKAESLE